MRFSVFLNARSMRPEEDRQLMHDLQAHSLLAGERGFSAIFLPDHHFNGYMPLASDSFIFAAWLAAKMPHTSAQSTFIVSAARFAPVRRLSASRRSPPAPPTASMKAGKRS